MTGAVLPTQPIVVRTDKAQTGFLFLIFKKILVKYNIYAEKCTTQGHFTKWYIPKHEGPEQDSRFHKSPCVLLSPAPLLQQG